MGKNRLRSRVNKVITYDRRGNVVRVSQGDHFQDLIYNDFGQVTTSRDHTLMEKKIGYSEEGYKISERSGAQAITVLDYDPMLRQALEIRDENHNLVIQREFNPDQMLSRLTTIDTNNTQTIHYQMEWGNNLHEILETKKGERFKSALDSWGNLIFTCGKLAGRSHCSGQQIFDADHRPINQSLPQYGTVPGSEMMSTLGYDYHNREILKLFSESPSQETEYKSNCQYNKIGTRHNFVECNDLQGNIVMQVFNGMATKLKVNEYGDLLSTESGFNINEWQFNESGEFLGQALSRAHRTVNYPLRQEAFGAWIYQKNEQGQLISISTPSWTPGGLNEFMSYDKDLLVQRRYEIPEMKATLTQNFSYNSLGMPTESRLFGVTQQTEYDANQKITNERLLVGENVKLTLPRVYTGHQLTSIQGLIRDIRYDHLGNIVEIAFNNRLTISMERFKDAPTLKKISYMRGQRYFWESYSWGEQLLGQKTWRSSLKEEEQYITYPYNSNRSFRYLDDEGGGRAQYGRGPMGGEVLDNPGPESLQLMAAYSSCDYLQELRRQDSQTRKVIAVKFFSSPESGTIVSCAREHLNSASLEAGNCLVRIDPDAFTYNQHIMKLIRVENFPVAVLIDDTIYPVISDYQGFIRGMLTADGSELLWYREYSLWGKKTIFYNQKARSLNTLKLKDRDVELSGSDAVALLERLTVWSYAGLTENPILIAKGLSGQETNRADIYWSQTRSYSAHQMRWTSQDPKILRSPRDLIAQPGNWNDTQYCSGDPVNCIDPSGYWAQYVVAGIGGGLVGAGVSAVTSVSMGKSGSEVVKSSVAGFVGGGVAGLLVASNPGSIGIAQSSFIGMQSAVAAKLTDIGLSWDKFNLQSTVFQLLTSAGIGLAGGMVLGAYAGRYADEPVLGSLFRDGNGVLQEASSQISDHFSSFCSELQSSFGNYDDHQSSAYDNYSLMPGN